MYVKTITIYAMINFISLGNNIIAISFSFLKGPCHKLNAKVALSKKILKVELLASNGK